MTYQRSIRGREARILLVEDCDAVAMLDVR
jgi:hypothetical protein